MNEPDRDARLDTLFAQARAHRADTSAAEFAFETRLLARLRATDSTGSIWARISWRLIPFFAICVAALTYWNAQTVTETRDAAALASLDHPEALDLGDGLN